MNSKEIRLEETVTLNEASELIGYLAHQESLLLLSPPGIGKTDMVKEAAKIAGLECRSLLGTQIAPEDISGIPRIVGERSVFCPPRVLLPESKEPFCLFLDELPACTPDVQKACYSLLLERRIGEHLLPEGSWVVAAGNRAQDRAMVRTVSSALLNRVIVLNIRVDVSEWLAWADNHQIDRNIRTYIEGAPESLLRPVPRDPTPFSTPRAWALLSEALHWIFNDQVTQNLPLSEQAAICRSIVAGRISEQDVDSFSMWWLLNRKKQLNQFEKGAIQALSMATVELDLPQYIVKRLQDESMTTVRDIVLFNRNQLRGLGLDAMHVDEIEENLQRHGFWLGMNVFW
jgi:hypothetical protein